MTDSCIVTRESEPVWEEAKGEHVTTSFEVYSGKCRVRHQQSTLGKDADAAGQLIVVSTIELHVPVGAAQFEPGDTVTVTSSVTRPAQTGRVFTIVSPFDGSQTTALRYRVEAHDERD